MEDSNQQILDLRIFGEGEIDSVQQFQNVLEAIQQSGQEITNLYSRCRRIKQIGGEPVSIARVELIGKNLIEYIKVTYFKEGAESSKTYPLSDFLNKPL